ncbi:hypothetical protein DAT35_56450 [Vitiosangium sp. GDMCC 1.1324]|nr:hypothetical protein DAT35_56450 [Vitiosangium sp. GDMCC 1.1324]
MQDPARSQTLDVRSNGEIETYFVPENDPGHIVLASTQHNVRSTWDQIIPGFYTLFAEAPNLLFYDRTAGLGEFYTTGERGVLQLLRRHDNLRRSWDLIVPGSFAESSGGTSTLLFYDRAAGLGEFYTTDGAGGMTLKRRHTNWRRSWNLIVPGAFVKPAAGAQLSFESLLFYDRAAGQGEFYATDGQGNISLAAKHTNWSRSWDVIIPYVHFGPQENQTFLMFYDRAAGLGEFYATDGKGNISLTAKHTNWRRSWDLIIPFKLPTGTNGLLFYDRAAGQGELYTVDGSGNISLVAQYTGWRHTWKAIVDVLITGSGGPLPEPGLLFYQP